MNKKFNVIFIKKYKIYILILIVLFINCNKEKIEFSEPTFIYNSYPLNPPLEQNQFYFSSLPYKNFLELTNDFNPLLEYLTTRISLKIQFIPLSEYYSVYNLLKNEQLDFAFVETDYLLKHKNDFDIEYLVQPIFKNSANNYVLLVNRNDQPIKTLKDVRSNIKDLSISFDNPNSYIGYEYPMNFLRKNDINIKNFKKIYFSSNFENIAQGILSGKFDLGFIDILTYSKYKTTAIGLKIIYQSEPVSHYVFVARKNLNSTYKKLIQQTFLELNTNNEKDKKILESIHQDLIGFKKFEEK